LLQSGPELGSIQARQGFDVNQESITGTPPGVPIGGQTTAGNEVVDVRMKSQVAGPGLQHAQETDLPANEAGVSRQLLQRRRRSLKQQVVHLALMTPGQRS
jgi:hypothetical protein